MKTPIRSCAGCGNRRPKSEMIRFGSRDGWRVTRGKVKLPGRGAYVCCEEGCLNRAEKRRALDRALGAKVPAAVLEQARRLIRESNEYWRTP